jgi:hypothetical protein
MTATAPKPHYDIGIVARLVQRAAGVAGIRPLIEVKYDSYTGEEGKPSYLAVDGFSLYPVNVPIPTDYDTVMGLGWAVDDANRQTLLLPYTVQVTAGKTYHVPRHQHTAARDLIILHTGSPELADLIDAEWDRPDPLPRPPKTEPLAPKWKSAVWSANPDPEITKFFDCYHIAMRRGFIWLRAQRPEWMAKESVKYHFTADFGNNSQDSYSGCLRPEDNDLPLADAMNKIVAEVKKMNRWS